MNRCDDDEKKNEKKSYKNVFKIFFSTIIIKIIIVIIIIIIIIEKNECAKYVDYFENFDCLSVCSVEFFDSLSILKKEEWNEDLKSHYENNLKEKLMCVVCFFVEFSMLENVHFDCEFCDSTLILFFAFCAWFDCLVCCFFCFIKLCRWKSIVVYAFFLTREKRIESWKKNYFHFLLFYFLLR